MVALRSIVLSLLVLALSWPVTSFHLLPGLGRPSFGHVRCGVQARCQDGARPLFAEGGVHDKTKPQFGLALMDYHVPPPQASKDEAAKREFELNRGQAVDTLLADYPTIFSDSCDLSIFHENILLRDTQGFALEGIRSYRAFFTVVPTLVNVAFSRGEVSALLMDKYGIDKSRIKIRWRIDLHPRSMGASLRDVFGWFDTNGDGVISNEEYLASQQSVSGERFPRAKKGVDPLVVEGISKYTLDAKGRITMHEIEVTSPTDYAFLEALRELLPVRQRGISSIPTCFSGFSASASSLTPTLAMDYHTAAQRQTRAHTSTVSVAEMVGELGMGEMLVGVLGATKTFPKGPGDGNDGAKDAGFGQALLTKLGGKQLAKKLKLPKQCKQDYDCNEGGYSWPLRCVDYVFAKICVDPDDNFGGGLGANNWDESQLVQVPIPVRVEDGWIR